MEINQIYILGAIGDGENEISADDVKSQYNPNSDKVIVHIDSDGGSVEEGLKMYDFLMEIPQEVQTIGSGMVASIATMPFLAGKVRELKPNTQFLAHLPSLGNFSGNSDEFQQASEYMQSIKDRIASIYSKHTGNSVDEMVALMRLDKPIFADVARNKGFATFVPEFKAVAKFNIDNMSETKQDVSKLDSMINGMKEQLNSIVAHLSPSNETDEEKPDNVMVRLADGMMIFVESEDGEFEGKRVFMVDEEGNRTETPVEAGTYQLEDGRSLTVDEDGVITSVQETSEENSEELENLKAENEALKAEVEALKGEATEAKNLAEETSNQKETLTNEVKALKETVEQVMTEIKNVKSMTVGAEPNVVKPHIKPENKNEEQGSQLEGWAAKFRK